MKRKIARIITVEEEVRQVFDSKVNALLGKGYSLVTIAIRRDCFVAVLTREIEVDEDDS